MPKRRRSDQRAEAARFAKRAGRGRDIAGLGAIPPGSSNAGREYEVDPCPDEPRLEADAMLDMLADELNPAPGDLTSFMPRAASVAASSSGKYKHMHAMAQARLHLCAQRSRGGG